MKKTMKKYISAILGAVSALCMIFGGVLTVKDNATMVAEASAFAATWSNGATADENGTTSFTLSGTGSTNEKVTTTNAVKADGLKVTLSSTETASESRFGFSFIGSSGDVTSVSPFNVMLRVPNFASDQQRIYIDDKDAIINLGGASDSNTIVYCNPDPNITAGQMGIGVTNGYGDTFVATNTNDYAYQFEFKDEGTYNHSTYGAYDYWSVTISIVKGSAHVSGSQLTVYFLESSLPLTADGKIYISAFSQYHDGFASNTFSLTIDEMPEVDALLNSYAYAKENSTKAATVAETRQAVVDAISSLPEADQAEYLEQLAAIDAVEYRWIARSEQTVSPSYNVATGHSALASKAWGHGYTYAEAVTLDGLTVILGSDDHLEQSRIGFGLVSALGGYPLADDPLKGTVNFMMIPQYASYVHDGVDTGIKFDGLFVVDSHNETPYTVDDEDTLVDERTLVYTILYADEDCTKNYLCEKYGQQLNWLPSFEATNTAYSITFNKCQNGNYKVTIHLLEGTAYASSEDVVAYLPAAQLDGVLDENGQCYIAAWGWPSISGGAMNPFYADVLDSDYAATYTAALSAIEEYEEAMRQGADETTLDSLWQELEGAMDGLNYYHYSTVFKNVEELISLNENMAKLQQSASLTLEESLTLNYKLTIPDELLAKFGGITVTVSVADETNTYGVGQFTNGTDGKWSCPIVEFGPQWMTENISLETVAIDLSGNILFKRSIPSYSLKTYCDTILADASASTAMKNAVADLLNYGAAAQEYANKNTDNLANEGLTYTSTTNADPANATDVLAVNQGTSVTFTAISAQLNDQVNAYAKFKYDGDASDLYVNMKLDGVTTSNLPISSLGNGYYRVESTALSPLQFDDEIIFVVFVNGTLDAKCRFSVNSYIKRNYTHEKAGDLIAALYKYSVGVTAYAKTLPVNVLMDVSFANGLNVYDSTSSSSTGILSMDNGSVTPSWIVGQWASQYDLGSVTDSNSSSFIYTFADASKKLEFNTNTDTVYMELNGSAEYTSDRTSGQSWPHLLLQQDYYNDDLVRIADQSSLRMKMEYTVTKCDDKMYGETDTSLHGAQFVWYITLQNRNTASNDYGQYIYFGILLYDNRYEGEERAESLTVDAGKADATGCLIYQPATSVWAPNGVSPKVGQTVSLDVDILALAKSVFEEAKASYASEGLFDETQWEDLYVGSTNFGFELPGTYDIGVEIANLGLLCVPNETLLDEQTVS